MTTPNLPGSSGQPANQNSQPFLIAVPRSFPAATNSGNRRPGNPPAGNPIPANSTATPTSGSTQGLAPTTPAPSTPRPPLTPNTPASIPATQTQPATPDPASRPGETRPAPAQLIRQPPPVYRTHGHIQGLEDMVRGVVISFPAHFPSFRQPIINPTPADTLTYIGQWIQSKIRKCVIVEIYPHHCIVLPLFTYGGQGLAARENKDEYISARDAVEGVTIATPSESPHGTIAITRIRQWQNANPNNIQDAHYIHPASYIHIAQPTIFNFSLPCIQEGYVSNDEYLEKLSKLYHARCPIEHVTADSFTVVGPRPTPTPVPTAMPFRGRPRGNFNFGRGRGRGRGAP